MKSHHRRPGLRAYADRMNARRFSIAALFAAVLAALVVALLPTGQVMSATGGPGGVTVTHNYSVSLFQVDGAWVLVVVSVPVLLALISVLVRNRVVKVAATVLLWIGCVLGMMSVGWFFLPTAVLMTFALRPAAPAQPISPMPVG